MSWLCSCAAAVRRLSTCSGAHPAPARATLTRRTTLAAMGSMVRTTSCIDGPTVPSDRVMGVGDLTTEMAEVSAEVVTDIRVSGAGRARAGDAPTPAQTVAARAAVIMAKICRVGAEPIGNLFGT